MKNKIKSFRALRYNGNKFKSPAEFLSLPYDVIDKKQQNEFYKKSKYNVIRLTLGKFYKNDNNDNNRYTRAYRYFTQWKKEGILIQEEKPSIYVYEQKYKLPFTNEIKTIRGFISLIKLQDYKKKRILPHEDVLAKPIEDRFNLTVHTNTQFSSIYGLYHDKKNYIDNTINKYLDNKRPLIHYDEAENIHHKLWEITDTNIIKNIQKFIGKKIIYIADGHHRYQTMLRYRDYYREKYGISPKTEHPVDYIMMFFVNMDHQGLSILPTHRILYNLKDMKLKALLGHIKDYFHLQVYNFSNQKEEKIVREKWYNDLKTMGKKMRTFGIYIKNVNRYFLLSLKDEEAYMKLSKIKKSKEWKRLDVTIIHTLLIDHILHITKKDISNQIYIDYTKDFLKAINQVKNDKYQVAIILNPAKVRDVVQIANNDEKMPQKSTYFYPKIMTGMTIYEMSDNSW